MTVPGFGGQGYVNSETRALSSIAESPGLDTSSGQDDLIRMLSTHDYQIKFMADQLKQAQKGINEAQQNPIQQIQSFISDIVVLFGGGQLVTGALDFGDLQYILPALGALFGFGDSPFPISLFEAAQKFFFGFVVPQQQFVEVVNRIIEGWLSVIGIDPEFIEDIQSLITAFGDLFDGITNLFPSLNELFGALGISGSELGPLGQALGPILNLFTGFDLAKFGNMFEFITDAMGPFIEQIVAIINFVNSILAVVGFSGGDVVNSPLGDLTNPFSNLFGLFGGVNFADPDFTSEGAMGTSINHLTGILDGAPQLVEGLVNAAIGWFSNITGLAQTFITAALNWVASIPGIATAIINGILAWVSTIPSFITAFINAALYAVTAVEGLISIVITTVIDWVSGTDGLAAIVVAAALGWVNSLPELAEQVIGSILEWITTVPELATSVITAALGWLTEIPELAASFITAALGWVAAVPDLAVSIITAALGWVTALPDLAIAVIDGVVTWFQAAPELVSTLVTAILDLTTQIPTLITGIFDSALGWVSDDSTGGFATTIITAALGWVTTFPDLIEPLITAVLSWVEAAPELAGAILEAVVTLISRAPEIAESIVTAIITVITSAPTLIVDVITSVLNWISDTPSLFGDILSTIVGLGGYPGSNIIGTLFDAVIPGMNASKITSGFFPTTMISGLSTFVSALTGPILQSLTTLATKLLTAPATVIGSLINNVVDGANGTMQQMLSGIFAGNSPLNTPAGGYGGVGGTSGPGGTNPPGYGVGGTQPTPVSTTYRAVQAANYQVYQLTAASGNVYGMAGGQPTSPFMGHR